MNPPHHSVRDLESVFPRLARLVNPHCAFVRVLERVFSHSNKSERLPYVV